MHPPSQGSFQSLMVRSSIWSSKTSSRGVPDAGIHALYSIDGLQFHPAEVNSFQQIAPHGQPCGRKTRLTFGVEKFPVIFFSVNLPSHIFVFPRTNWTGSFLALAKV